jgi:integrase
LIDLSTFRGRLNDTSIRKFLDKQKHFRFKDDRYQGLQVRASENRTKAHFHLVVYVEGKEYWKKLGYYPQSTTEVLVGNLDKKAVDLRNRVSTAVAICNTFGDVFDWYLSRLDKDKSLTPKRRENLKSNINCHFIPKLADHDLTKLDRNSFDQEFILPLVEDCEDSTVKGLFKNLKSIMKRAKEIEVIEHNPLQGVSLNSFVDLHDNKKDCRLNEFVVRSIFIQLHEQNIEKVMLIVLMLLHGFRVGESRKMKFSAISSDFITLPSKDVKTRTQLRLPLTKYSKSILLAYQEMLSGKPLLFARKKGDCISAQDASKWVLSIANKQWSAHDCRKFARTVLFDQDVDFIIGELIINHKIPDVSDKYLHSTAEKQKISALNNYHEYLFSIGLELLLTKTLPRYKYFMNLIQAA